MCTGRERFVAEPFTRVIWTIAVLLSCCKRAQQLHIRKHYQGELVSKLCTEPTNDDVTVAAIAALKSQAILNRKLIDGQQETLDAMLRLVNGVAAALTAGIESLRESAARQRVVELDDGRFAGLIEALVSKDGFSNVARCCEPFGAEWDVAEMLRQNAGPQPE